jgi:hypothetical protein
MRSAAARASLPETGTNPGRVVVAAPQLRRRRSDRRTRLSKLHAIVDAAAALIDNCRP